LIKNHSDAPSTLHSETTFPLIHKPISEYFIVKYFLTIGLKYEIKTANSDKFPKK